MPSCAGWEHIGSLMQIVKRCPKLGALTLHVNNETIYNNSTFGDCLLYASDTEDSTYPSIHLGRSQLCAFAIYGELCVTVFALVFFFFLLFKVVVGCAL